MRFACFFDVRMYSTVPRWCGTAKKHPVIPTYFSLVSRWLKKEDKLCRPNLFDADGWSFRLVEKCELQSWCFKSAQPVLYLARAHPRPRPRSPCGAASEHTGRGSNLRPPKEDPKLSVCLASASSKSQKENQNTAKGTNTKRLNGHTEREMSSEAGPN